MGSASLCLHTGADTTQVRGLVVPENQLGLFLSMRVLRSLLDAALRTELRAHLLGLRWILLELSVQLECLLIASTHEQALIRWLLGLVAHLMLAPGGSGRQLRMQVLWLGLEHCVTIRNDWVEEND